MGLACLSALICYTENEGFREPIINEQGVIEKDGFTSSPSETRLRVFNLVLVALMCKFLYSVTVHAGYCVIQRYYLKFMQLKAEMKIKNTD